MNLRRLVAWIVLTSLVAIMLVACGEKIAIPERLGTFSTDQYELEQVFTHVGIRQLAVADRVIYTIDDDSLTMRDLQYDITEAVGGFGDLQALCIDQGSPKRVFVWDQAAHRVSWFDATDLAVPTEGPPGTDLPDVGNCVSMATSTQGIDVVGAGSTFLYLSDPVDRVVYRYLYDPYSGLTPYGVLAVEGDGAGFVKRPVGLARDNDFHVLVCDTFTFGNHGRNWVIRFDATPGDPDDDYRGSAVRFDPDNPVCEPPAPAELVLGDARQECEAGIHVQSDSTSAPGVFLGPTAVAVDGGGRIYVSDSENYRIQVFERAGAFALQFGGPGDMEGKPGSLATIVADDNSGPIYGAFVLVVIEDKVLQWKSGLYNDDTHDIPDPLE